MSASPAVMARAANESPEANKVVVPAKWRALQLGVIGFIALLAALYALVGWRAPAGESGLANTHFQPISLAGFVVLAGLAWLTTPAAFVIARTTFQEAVRRRWMLGMLGFGLVLMLLSTLFSSFQAGEERNFLRDFGLGFIIIITMLMAIFLGVALVPPEIERRTIFTVLSKPVDRLEFLIGKFLGLCCTLFVNMMLMSAMFLFSYSLVMYRREGAKAFDVLMPTHPGLAFEITNLARALLLQYSEIIVIAALALALSLMMSGIVAIITSFIVYFLGQMASYWEHVRENGTQFALAAPISAVLTLLYYLLPKFDKFDVRERIVNNMPIAMNYWWPAFGSGLVYAAILLAVAYAFFSDREF